MKHLTRKEIEAWAAAQDWSLSDSEVSRQSGVDRQVVSYRRQVLGIPIGKGGKLTGKGNQRITPEMIEQIDWNQSYAEIARRLGCSRSRVQQISQAIKNPRA